MLTFETKVTRHPRLHRTTLLCAAVLSLSTANAPAEDHFWSSLGGGSFNYAFNWTPTWVPGEDDNAIFELGMDPAYLVTFYESVVNDQCIFRTDKVVMDLGSCTYTLDHPDFGLIVGDDAGHIAEVELSHGTLDTLFLHVGLWDDSSGVLDLGAGLTVNVSNVMVVGNDGDGTLNINDHASVSALCAAIGGHDFGNTGEITVSGASAELSVEDMLVIGEQGHGTLNIQSGGSVTSLYSNVGTSPFAQGTVTVTGADSTFSLTDSLNIATDGHGVLTVEEGGAVDSVGIICAAWWEGSSAALTVSGENSSISTDGQFVIADLGQATLDIDQGGHVTAADAAAGGGSTGQGAITVTGPDSALTVNETFNVGGSGNGSLMIDQGGKVETGGIIRVAWLEGSSGTVTVTGEGSSLSTNDTLDIGDSGPGTMVVEKKATVHANSGVLGWAPTGVGELTLYDAGTKLTVTNEMVVGDYGHGTLTVNPGTVFESTGALMIGASGNGTASIQSGTTCSAAVVSLAHWEVGDADLTISGGSTALEIAEEFNVAERGQGDVTIDDEAQVTAGNITRIGRYETGDGQVSVAGDNTFLDTGDFHIGEMGSGWMDVSQGAEVTSVKVYLGTAETGVGTLDIHDADSVFSASDAVFIGNSGSGTVIVHQYGDLSAESLFIGAGGTGDGELTVTGYGSYATVENTICIGQWGTGAMKVTGGADVRTLEGAGWIKAGNEAGSDGTILVNGGSHLTAEQAPIVVGGSGQGLLTISGGSYVQTAGELFVGGSEAGVGQMTVTGADSTYESLSGYSTYVGQAGLGTLNISDGGLVKTAWGFVIAGQPGSTGEVNLNGAGSTLDVGFLMVGDAGNAVLSVNDGRVALHVDPATVPAGEVHIGEPCELRGTGSIVGNVRNIHGTVKPGGTIEPNYLTGTLTVDGDFEQHFDGTAKFELAGEIPGEEFSTLNITGAAVLSGHLVVECIEGYEPLVGQEFTIINADQIDGEFDTVSGTGQYSVKYNDQNVTVTIVTLLKGDVNGDGIVNIDDLFEVLGAWGPCPDPPALCPADVNGDGRVNIDDLFAILGNWT